MDYVSSGDRIRTITCSIEQKTTDAILANAVINTVVSYRGSRGDISGQQWCAWCALLAPLMTRMINGTPNTNDCTYV